MCSHYELLHYGKMVAVSIRHMHTSGGVTPIDSIVTAVTALSQQSTVKPCIRISAVNGRSGVGQRSNPSVERTRLVLQFAPNLVVGLHIHGTLIS